MLYCDWNINLVEIFINLILVGITTAVTYFVFTVIPKNKRKETIKVEFKKLKNCLISLILDDASEFKETYELYEKKQKVYGDLTMFWDLIKIENYNKFKRYFTKYSNIKIRFENIINAQKLVFLLNSLTFDEKDFIKISFEISDLLNIMRKIDADAKNLNLNKIKNEKEISKNIEYNESIRLTIDSIENLIKISNSIILFIDDYCK